MAERDHYLYPGFANARVRADEYREKAKALVVKNRDTISEALFVAEVGGTSYAVARLSGGAGPDGRSLLNMPIELVIGAALGAAGIALIGKADKESREESAKHQQWAGHLLAVGAGAIAAYTSRLGFEAGLAKAKPPAEQASANQVSGAPAAAPYYYVPAPQQWMLPAMTSPPMLPSAFSAPAPRQEMAPVTAVPMVVQGEEMESESIGADEIESAVEILDRMNRR